HFNAHATDEQRAGLAAFVSANEQRDWLRDWTLFMALKRRFGGSPWTTWETQLAQIGGGSLADAWKELGEEIRFHEYVQFLFFRQWATVRAAAAARGTRIIGFAPLAVSHDSADSWANRVLF